MEVKEQVLEFGGHLTCDVVVKVNEMFKSVSISLIKLKSVMHVSNPKLKVEILLEKLCLVIATCCVF